MTLTIDDVVTYYVFSSHPKNKAIVDIKDKKTGDLRYIKIRHRLSKIYAISLVDPVTFEVWSETQVKSASARVKPIVLHVGEKENTTPSFDNKNSTSVEFRESSWMGFEWVFTWEGEKYKWVRENRMSNTLECKAIRKTGDICVAQYLPRILKDEYFGIFSLLGYNILRCNLTKSRELELILIMSLMTLLDKSNDGDWKKDQISIGVNDDVLESYKKTAKKPSRENDFVPPIAYEDPIPKKEQQKKYKAELLNDQKLQLLLEKDVKRSQKQIQSDHKRSSLSAGNSPSHTPKTSPLPTPSTSSSNLRSSKLSRQKSTSILNYSSGSNSSSISTDPSIALKDSSIKQQSENNSTGRLSKMFNSLSHIKHGDHTSSSTYTNPSSLSNSNVNTSASRQPKGKNVQMKSHILPQESEIQDQQKYLRRQISQSHLLIDEDQHSDQEYHRYYNHQLSLPIGYVSQFTNDFSNLSVQSNKQYDNPPSIRTIIWNQEPVSSTIVTNDIPIQSSQKEQHHHYVRRSNSSKRPYMDSGRRMSGSEYNLYHTYHPNQSQHYLINRDRNHHRYSSYEHYIHPHQQPHYY